MPPASLDQTRRAAVDLAQRQERAETSRSMHDHALQTMEVLAREGWIADESVRGIVAGEAAWLRAWLEDRLGSVISLADRTPMRDPECLGGDIRQVFRVFVQKEPGSRLAAAAGITSASGRSVRASRRSR